jgi:hypothetical protein
MSHFSPSMARTQHRLRDRFCGPKAGVVDPAMHREQVSQGGVILGRDAYRAVLALGEIAPEFEGKQVILAERMDDRHLMPSNCALSYRSTSEVAEACGRWRELRSPRR